MKRDIKRLRKVLWESMVGCDCSAIASKDERCTAAWIRCNGRMRIVKARYAHYGLAVGPGSADGDGLDPNASAASVKRRESTLASMGRDEAGR